MLNVYFLAIFFMVSNFQIHYVNTSLINNARSWSNINIRKERQANTDCDGFQCLTSNECIEDDNYCDGHVDCKDGSDETTKCKNLGCPGYLFRCNYGACISSNFECDGKIDCKDGSDENSPKCPNGPSKSNSNLCKDTEFECKSGQCISIDNKCDGTPDCNDKSDETEEICARLNCPGYTFKCKYGACISRLGLCNGISECFDDSDEDNCDGVITSPTSQKPPVELPTNDNNRPPPVNTPNSCVLPKIENGEWQILGTTPYKYKPGDRVSAFTSINILCKNGFKVIEKETRSICAENWIPAIPQCVQTCRELKNTETTFVSCTLNGAVIDCGKAVTETKAKFSCAAFHELPTNYEGLYCRDGNWDRPTPICTPVCGEKNVKVKELIINGQIVKRGTYPWSIAIYRNKTGYEHICGGSLISQRAIVTAAHCVSKADGKAYPASLFRVAAGKYYRDYSDSRDTDAEFSDIKSIHVHSRYKAGTYKYEGDIAILITKEAFNATQFIQRICIDYQNTMYDTRLYGTKGIVTGWGFTIRGDKPSEVLKEIALPYIDDNTCFNALDEEYQSYLTHDKFCAGYWNNGTGVCEGDSGGGLAFINTGINKRYYLRGIVSIAPQIDGSCDENEYALFTKLSVYIDFIAPYRT